MFKTLPKWGRTSIVVGAGILGIMAVTGRSKSFTAEGDDDDFSGFTENSCHICERPYEFSKIARGLVQHYLKESDDGTKDWKSKKNPDGTRKTARNVAGAELYWYGLDALEHYMAKGKESKIKPLVVDLIRKSIVPNIIAGDVHSFIESLEIEGMDEEEPTLTREEQEKWRSETFEAEDTHCNTCNKTTEPLSDDEVCDLYSAFTHKEFPRYSCLRSGGPYGGFCSSCKLPYRGNTWCSICSSVHPVEMKNGSPYCSVTKQYFKDWKKIMAKRRGHEAEDFFFQI